MQNQQIPLSLPGQQCLRTARFKQSKCCTAQHSSFCLLLPFAGLCVDKERSRRVCRACRQMVNCLPSVHLSCTGTHLSSPIPVAPPMSQPLRLPAAGPVPSTVMSSPQAFVQQKQQQQLPSVQALPASTLGLPAAIVAMSSGLSAAPRPAASAGASPVVDACQPTMWVVPRSATPPGAPVVLGPDGQPVPHQMYYTMHPMQQVRRPDFSTPACQANVLETDCVCA